MGLVPELPGDHIERDIELCQRLITEVFDPEKDIESSVEKIVKSLEDNQVPKEQVLDTLTLYLRQIHGYNFFDGTKCEDERALASKCGPQHLRTKQTSAIDRAEFESSPLYASARQYEKAYVSAAEKTIQAGP